MFSFRRSVIVITLAAMAAGTVWAWEWEVSPVYVDGWPAPADAPTSLAVDSADHPHISTHGIVLGDLWYLHHDGVQWSRSQIIQTGYGVSSLALDSTGMPRVCFVRYYSPVPTAVICSAYDGVTWNPLVVEEIASYNIHLSLALDAGDHPHVSYGLHDLSGQHFSQLKYAAHDGASWAIEVVEEGTGVYQAVGTYNDIAVDPQANPHISYGGAGRVLNHACCHGGSWTTVNVDPADTGRGTSIVLDSQGHAHIVHTGPWIYGLRYSHFDGAQWHTEVLDPSIETSMHTSLAIDRADRLHLSYWYANPSDRRDKLMYGFYDGAEWHMETVDEDTTELGTFEVGAYSAIALTAAGMPRISYTRNGHLHYAIADWEPASAPSSTDEMRLVLAGRPNPFAEGTRILFQANGSDEIGLSIIDPSGRRICDLTGAPASGDGIWWDGRDNHGRPVPAGLYYAILRQNGAVQIGRVLRVE